MLQILSSVFWYISLYFSIPALSHCTEREGFLFLTKYGTQQGKR